MTRGSQTEDGFTLVELLLAIVIMGIITVPLGNVVVDFLRHTDATTARLLESHDVQLASAYWAQDVASIGMRDESSPYGLKPSVETDEPVSSSQFPCGSATPLAGFAWDDSSVDPVTLGITSTVVRVAYLLVPTASGPIELHRLRCEGSSAVDSDVTLARHLDPDDLPSLTCSSAGEKQDCEAPPAGPATVTLKVTIKDPKNLGAEYRVTLTGQRRQSS